MPLNENNNDIPNKQRALVLQGGGALGAYESGVLTVLCKELAHEYREGPLFDIVAATSMGAMNAAVLASNVVNRKKTWEEAAKELENFWIDEEKVYPLLQALAIYGGMTQKSRRSLVPHQRLQGDIIL